jgi:hypothetical protein
MILVEYRHPCDGEMFCSFIIIVFDCKHLLSSFAEARIFPLAFHGDLELSKVYTDCISRDPRRLSRIWDMKSGKVVARVAPRPIRGKILFVVDVGITSSRIRSIMELVVQWSAP